MNKLISTKAHMQILSRTKPVIGLIVGCLVLIICLFLSVSYGAADISWSSVYDSLMSFDGSREHLIIRTVRLPRSLLAMIVGASISTAGAIMQGITRNPLADPRNTGN